MLTSSLKNKFINKWDFLTKIDNFKKNKIKAYLWKIDVKLIEQFKHQNNEKLLKKLIYIFF